MDTFDYLVTQCWAKEVRAGRGREGDELPTLTDWTFRVFSSVQKAVDAAHGETVAILVTAGDYKRRWWEFWKR